VIRVHNPWLPLCLVLVCVATARAQDPAQYFRQNCASCHSIGGGRLVGPDLKGVTARQDRAWLTSFIVNPQAVIDGGDPYAQQLLGEASGVVMPASPGISPALAGALLDFIDAESAKERSEFAGTQVSDRPFGPADVSLGHDLFTGDRRLTAGGPPCLSCHSVGGVGAMGGGKLGPDLTLAFERLNGRSAMGAWLGSPATPTMQTLFRDGPLTTEEIEPLLAFFEDAAKRRAEADAVAPLTFFLLGLGGAAAGVVVCDLAWLGRFRSVRRRLVDAATRRG
jgi:mono/diheme cytochrome c family protein